ncbi:unnamed protein product [Pseudo-nitzschia multistriata]|uniref:Alpha 1,4-glycosyltransferase domain-containing protein n=1 Tax=Pseudo-nitzschia multistriata TaxID=183589 RepID=A0A448ZGR0_9STRA|nr:unnamed protein product [Pseudo-nitzschia multistriata]
MPVVLTAKDVWKENGQKHLTQSRYESVQSRLDALKLDDFSRVVFHKWIAMTVAGGGWFSDYDSFPLPSLYRENGGDIIRGDELPNNGHITVYDMISPTLASGSANSWIDVLEALLDDAEEHCRQTEGSKTYHRYDLDCFYTDSLAIHSLRKKQHKLAPHTERKIATPFDKHDPVSNDDTGLCSSEKFVKKWTVHFGPGILQRSGHIPPRARRPKYRLNVAEDWMGRFERLCS